jgi:hypothetical protein
MNNKDAHMSSIAYCTMTYIIGFCTCTDRVNLFEQRSLALMSPIMAGTEEDILEEEARDVAHVPDTVY